MSDDEFIYIAVRVYIVACNKENRAKMATPLGLLTEKDCNSTQISFIKKIILPQLYNGLTHILYSTVWKVTHKPIHHHHANCYGVSRSSEDQMIPKILKLATCKEREFIKSKSASLLASKALFLFFFLNWMRGVGTTTWDTTQVTSMTSEPNYGESPGSSSPNEFKTANNSSYTLPKLQNTKVWGINKTRLKSLPLFSSKELLQIPKDISTL